MSSARSADARLRLFVERVDALIEMRPIQEGTIRANWNFNYKAGSHPQSSLDIGDADHFRSVLLVFRRFVANDSDVQFYKIANLVETDVTHPACRANFRELRQAWSRAMTGPLGVVIDEVPFRAERAFDLVTNAYLFHDDVDKEAEFEAMPVMIQDLVETKVANLVIDCLGILWPTRNNLKTALDGTL